LEKEAVVALAYAQWKRNQIFTKRHEEQLVLNKNLVSVIE